uniref:Retrovirus-related Pol polyprotein from transposon TNT 1-94 n=1 Tax=Cajanus cajan TaxID=3821 RepID=A0A151RBV1_CAJCA|nr:Retrovirus-related Pol polyprotein from transposon TNT 1-94 [Cajanus cajan]
MTTNYNIVWSGPKLDGKLDYNYWALLMSTHLKAHNIWRFIEPGLQQGADDATQRKDQLALSQIHQGVDYSIFGKIANAKTAKEAWDILKLSYKGVEKAQKSKLQSLRREYERYEMTNSESVEQYFSRVTDLVNKMRVYGEDIPESKVVEKILRTMPMKKTSLKANALSRKEYVSGLPVINILEGICETCEIGKKHRESFPTGKSWRARKPLEIVHSDLCMVEIPTHGGSRYFITFIDDFSRKAWVYFLKQKSEACDAFKSFKAFVEKQSGCKIKALRTDRGQKYLACANFFDHHGIQHQMKTRYTPQQNGIAERKNRTIMDMVRCLLKAKQMPREFWAEAVSTAVYILIRCPTKSVCDKTPEEAWSGRRPSIQHRRIFGCITYAHVPNQLRKKLDDKGEKCIFIGYSTNSKAYKLYNPVTKKSNYQ